jgi:hypothetical protein
LPNSGFVAGTNTLVFDVSNEANTNPNPSLARNPTGLQVHFDSSSIAAVPEPETYAMMLAGLGMMGFMVRRKLH